MVFKSMTGGVMQLGLPERRVSQTVTVQTARGGVDDVIDNIMVVAQRRMEGSQLSGSMWTFHAFVSVTIRAYTNVALNSGLADNKIGGTGHGETPFILVEAEDDGTIADDEEEEGAEDDGQMLYFIDDTEIEQEGGDERAMYREIDAEEAAGRHDVIATPTAKTVLDYPIEDYLIPEDEVVDVISGEDSDHGDREPREKSLEEASDILGVTLSADTAKRLNMAIDKVMINTWKNSDGYCTYHAVLNSIFAKRFGPRQAVTEERFARTLPAIHRVLQPYKEQLRYVTVAKVVDIIANINDELTKVGYALNIYERKPKTFLIDVITNRKKNNTFMISVIQALYWYSDLEEGNPDYVHLMFRRVE